MWSLAFLFALSTLAIPGAAQACHKGGCGGCGYGSGTGVIYNSSDCKWYPVPGSGRNVVYRAVDDKYIPVSTYGCGKCHRVAYKHHHKYHHGIACNRNMVAVICQPRPTHWFNGHWYPDTKECFYKVVR